MMEQRFVECGDSVFDNNEKQKIDQQVKVIVRVIQLLNRYAIKQGRWSNAPVAPQMFG